MTEAEWLACVEPKRMLEFLQSKTSERKLRLFAVSCCCRIRISFFNSEVSVRLLRASELFADGMSNEEQMKMLELDRWEANGTLKWANTQDPVFPAEGAVAALWPKLRISDVMKYVSEVAGYENAVRAAELSGQKRSFRWWKRRHNLSKNEIQKLRVEGARYEERLFCNLLHDIFGNPFRPVTLNPTWLTSTVLALATGIYEEKAFDRMPILADALQDAECDNADILNHCRQPGEHTRGCFVVDLLLGKS
jgi:hypothetical protein